MHIYEKDVHTEIIRNKIIKIQCNAAKKIFASKRFVIVKKKNFIVNEDISILNSLHPSFRMQPGFANVARRT